MCTNAIKIKNSSRTYRDGFDKMFFNVPCGRCEECQKKQQDDWFVRAYFEWLRIRKVGGCVFFPTFTYNNENIPYYIDEERDFMIPCFNHSHIKKFRDKLRVYLSRRGYDAKGIRYLFCSEYGSHTKRPHYHCLLFVPFKISIREMLELCRKSWIYGYTMVSRRGFELQSANGVQYVMKYISKDFIYYNDFGIDKYLFDLKSDVFNKVPFADDVLKEFRSCLPRHYQSIGFGSDLVTELYNDVPTFLSGKLDLSKYGFVTLKKFSYSIPRYVIRKMLYVHDVFGLDVPSQFHESVFPQIFENTVNNTSEQIQNFLLDRENFMARYSVLRGYHLDLERYWNFLSSMKSQIHDIVVYNMVYKDVPITDKNIMFYDYRTLLNNACYFAYTNKFRYDLPVAENCSVSVTNSEMFDDRRFTFGNLRCFRNFDKFLEIINLLNRFSSERCSEANKMKMRKERFAWYVSPYVLV